MYKCHERAGEGETGIYATIGLKQSTIRGLGKQLKLLEDTSEKQELPPMVAAPVNQLLVDWEQRRDDTQRAIEIIRFKLTSLKTNSTAWYTSAGEAITEFFMDAA